MDKICIKGGVPLEGVIPIGGAKNAALPLMAASLLTPETLTLKNIPGSGRYRHDGEPFGSAWGVRHARRGGC